VAGSLLAGLEKMAKALEEATYPPGDYEKIARSAAHAQKAADGLVRLMEFARAGRDSRAEIGTDWLRALTNEQLAIVSGFIEANGAAATRPADRGASLGEPRHTRRGGVIARRRRGAGRPIRAESAAAAREPAYVVRLRMILEAARLEAARRGDPQGAADEAMRDMLALLRGQPPGVRVAALALTTRVLLVDRFHRDLLRIGAVLPADDPERIQKQATLKEALTGVPSTTNYRGRRRHA